MKNPWKVIILVMILFVCVLVTMSFIAVDTGKDMQPDYLAVGFIAFLFILVGFSGIWGHFIDNFPAGKAKSLFFKGLIQDNLMKITLGKGLFPGHSKSVLLFFSWISFLLGLYLILLLILNITISNGNIPDSNVLINNGVLYTPLAMLPLSIILIFIFLGAIVAFIKAYPVKKAPNKIVAILTKLGFVLVYIFILTLNLIVFRNYTSDLINNKVIGNGKVSEMYHREDRKLINSKDQLVNSNNELGKCVGCSYSTIFGSRYIVIEVGGEYKQFAVNQSIFNSVEIGEEIKFEYHSKSNELYKIYRF